MTRWKLTVEYKGTDYCGWQRQEILPSIQQAIEEAVHKFCRQDVTLHVAGRTDAGVHAKGQVAHLDLPEREITGYELMKAINAHLRPQPVSIIKAEIADAEFHARFKALNKLYHYRIINRWPSLTFDSGLAYLFRRELDVKAMQNAATVIIGHHDFTTFRDTECQAKSPVKTLDRLDITVRDYDGQGGREILIAAEAKSFLHHQVRNMVGTLVLVGEGKWTKKDVEEALAAKDRTCGGPTAPAEGLYLVRVDY